MFLLADEYGRYTEEDLSEVILFKKYYEWEKVKKVVEKAKKDVEDTDDNLYEAIWNALEENFEVEDSFSINDAPYCIEW